jgi:hypothetical protein
MAGATRAHSAPLPAVQELEELATKRVIRFYTCCVECTPRQTYCVAWHVRAELRRLQCVGPWADHAHLVLPAAACSTNLIGVCHSYRGCKLLDRVTYPRDPVFGGIGFGGRAPAMTGADLLAAPGLVRTLGAISSIACHHPARHVPLFNYATAYLPQHMPTGKVDAAATQNNAGVFMSGHLRCAHPVYHVGN